jgi:hypothetical protein
MFMHFYSWQTIHVKMATVSSLFLHALRICDLDYLMQPDYLIEIDYLKNSFKQLADPDRFVTSALSNARIIFLIPEIHEINLPKNTKR